MCAQESQCVRCYNIKCRIDAEGFQAVTSAVSVAVGRKRCKIVT